MKTLIFEGAGWDKASSSSDVGNCRIRTRIKNDAGEFVYLEISAREGTKYDKPALPFPITGFVHHCYSQDCNESSDWRILEHNRIDYTAAGLLRWVNEHLGCSFEALSVVNDGSIQVHETWQPLCESTAEVAA